jgi:hypothetical protein
MPSTVIKQSKLFEFLNGKETNFVFTTKDYGLFKPIDGNRNLNHLHLSRLKKSIINNYLYTVIIINEKYEIIDGQHRYNVAKELNLPLNYIICEGYGLEEVHILNKISKTWNADDYLAGYCNLGYKDYIIYDEFKKKYGFGHYESMLMLSEVYAKHLSETFSNGNFKVKDYASAVKLAENIKKIGKIYDGYKRKAFVACMYQLTKHNPNFDFDEFHHKLKLQPTLLVDCATSTQYKDVIEEIYNYKRRDKISFRYSK